MSRLTLLLLSALAYTPASASTTPAPEEAGTKATTAAPPAAITAHDAGATEAPPSVAGPGPRSPHLRNRDLRSPMPGGHLGGWNGDTGLDIAGNHLAVHAIAAGTLDYSEWGHTLWTRGRDTAFSVRLALDQPLPWGSQRITHVYYTHLSRLESVQPEGARVRKHVEAGEPLGVSGMANGVPHLHLGFLLDGQVEQDSWTFILREGDVRKVMGSYKNGELLPPAPVTALPAPTVL